MPGRREKEIKRMGMGAGAYSRCKERWARARELNESSSLLINYQYTHIISATRKATTCASCAVCNANKLWCYSHNHMTCCVCMIITENAATHTLARAHTHINCWCSRSLSHAYILSIPNVILLFNKHTLIHFWFVLVHHFHLSACANINNNISLSIVPLW